MYMLKICIAVALSILSITTGLSQLSMTDNSLTILGSGPFDHTYSYVTTSPVLQAEMMGGKIPPEHPEGTQYMTYAGEETINDGGAGWANNGYPRFEVTVAKLPTGEISLFSVKERSSYSNAREAFNSTENVNDLGTWEFYSRHQGYPGGPTVIGGGGRWSTHWYM